MNIEDNYLDLLVDILTHGVEKEDRTGTGTISIFGRQIRHDMSQGFPLLTTKKMFTKGIVHELLWFLKGDTNIKYLVDNDVNIWTGDAYKKYINVTEKEALDLSEYGDRVNYRPHSKDEFTNKIKTDDDFSKKWGDLGSVYGKQWIDWGGTPTMWIPRGTEMIKLRKPLSDGVNQIQNCINQLKDNPDSRRIMVNAWNVSELDKMTLPPCHYGFQLYTRELSLDERIEISTFWYKDKVRKQLEDSTTETTENYVVDKLEKQGIPTRKVSLMWNQRSVDTFLGLPFNIASYGLLLHMFAQQVNMIPGELIGNLGDVHIYKNHVDQVKVQLSRKPKTLPTLKLDKADDIFSYCYENVIFENYNPNPTITGKLST
jgi:thymidylate synthase